MALRLPLLVRRTHKWLALVVGVQALIWAVSGMYMTAIHIDTIHGDHFVRAADPRPIRPASLINPIEAARAPKCFHKAAIAGLGDHDTWLI